MKKALISIPLALCLMLTAVFSGCTGLVKLESYKIERLNTYYLDRINDYGKEGVYLIEGIKECAVVFFEKEGSAVSAQSSTVKGDVTVQYTLTAGNGSAKVLDNFFYIKNFQDADSVFLENDGESEEFVKVVRGDRDILTY